MAVIDGRAWLQHLGPAVSAAAASGTAHQRFARRQPAAARERGQRPDDNEEVHHGPASDEQ
jgi:hypothetical protein